MRVALVLPQIWIASLLSLMAGSPAGDARKHPAVQEVLVMTNAFVAPEVVLERVRRMPEVPALEDAALDQLAQKGVAEDVLLELAERGAESAHCAIPQPRLEPHEILDDPSIRSVLRYYDEGASVAEVAAFVGELPSVPVVDGWAIKALFGKGVPSKVLIALVRRQPEPADCDPVLAPEPAGTGEVVVITKSALPVTYLEILLNDEVVLRQGRLHEGEVAGGWTLARPRVLALKGNEAVFEHELPAGQHQVKAVFGLTRVVPSAWDVAAGARGERYDTTIIGPEGAGANVAVCDVREGWTCVVVARVVKRGIGYVVAYDLKMAEDRASQRRRSGQASGTNSRSGDAGYSARK